MRFLVLTALLATPVLADDPKCTIEKTCTITSDNCVPAEGEVIVTALDAYKATVQLNDGPALETNYMGLNGVLVMLFKDGKTQHQPRIQDSGSFYYLVSTPNADANQGKDQIVYRGTCVEGS